MLLAWGVELQSIGDDFEELAKWCKDWLPFCFVGGVGQITMENLC
jgi:hypothetical protein